MVHLSVRALGFPLPFKSVVPGGANTRPALWLWVVTISGPFLTWLQIHTEQSHPPPHPSTSVAALCLICYSFSFFHLFLSASALSVFLRAVSKHIVYLFTQSKACKADFSTDPFQSVCITLSVNSCISLSFVAPSEISLEWILNSYQLLYKWVWFCRCNCLCAARQKGNLFYCCALFIHVKEE